MRWQLLHDHQTVSAENIVYVGDDPIKDGQMAQNYGVAFVLIDQKQSEASWQRAETTLLLAVPPNAA
jgi:ribonucleotide monophosphatase NagD (HAD superfamily)